MLHSRLLDLCSFEAVLTTPPPRKLASSFARLGPPPFPPHSCLLPPPNSLPPSHPLRLPSLLRRLQPAAGCRVAPQQLHRQLGGRLTLQPALQHLLSRRLMRWVPQECPRVAPTLISATLQATTPPYQALLRYSAAGGCVRSIGDVVFLLFHPTVPLPAPVAPCVQAAMAT